MGTSESKHTRLYPGQSRLRGDSVCSESTPRYLLHYYIYFFLHLNPFFGRAPAVRPPRLERVIGLTLLPFYLRVIGSGLPTVRPLRSALYRERDRSSAWQPYRSTPFFFFPPPNHRLFGRAPAVRPPRLERVIGLTLLPSY
jgi:hypothetical protein